MYSLLTTVLQPYILLGLWLLVALVPLVRRRALTRRGLILLLLPILLLTVLCIPAVGYLALGSLEWHYEPLPTRPADTDAIVVLSGGVRVVSSDGTAAELDSHSIERCLQAAEFYHQGMPCTVVVSGGRPDPRTPEPTGAALMKELLLRLGVKAADILVEDRSRNTHENVVNSLVLLRERQLDKVILVTDAFHMLRADLCFRKAGLAVTPGPCAWHAIALPDSLRDYVPRPAAAGDVDLAWHEWLGLAWYWWKGWI
jgi:uncharacterized SAM-binding protein YcdF (DUF218 family)